MKEHRLHYRKQIDTTFKEETEIDPTYYGL